MYDLPEWAGKVVESSPARLEQVVCGTAVVAASGGQTPGVTVNGVALRPPQSRLLLENRSATTSGYHKQKVSIGVSAETNPMAASKSPTFVPESNKAQGESRLSGIGPARTARGRARASGGDEPPANMCCGTSFKGKRELRRHQTATKAHGAEPVGECSCGKTVTRRDAMASHRRYCKKGTTKWLK